MPGDVHCPSSLPSTRPVARQQLMSCAGCRCGTKSVVQCAHESLVSLQILDPVVQCVLQEHFYLEPHCSVVIPKEHDEFEVYASTQVQWRSDCTDAPELCCCSSAGSAVHTSHAAACA